MDSLTAVFEKISRLLLKEKATAATMESCTGGLIASCLTDIPGSSGYFVGGFVTYNNNAKISQGVEERLLRTYGVYSRETALAMAEVCRLRFGTTYGLGITGTLSQPDSANGDSIPGQVHIAVCREGKSRAASVILPRSGSRREEKHAAACEAGTLLLRFLEADSHTDVRTGSE